MNPTELAARIKAIAENWPIGFLVWHKACGKRGVIVEYAIDGLGCVMIFVSFGANESCAKCLPIELSATRITADTDGEDWRNDNGSEGSNKP